jgi:hypothetical protein
MLIETDIKKIGTIDTQLLNSIATICLNTDWSGKNFNRSEISLTQGRLCLLPYPIKKPTSYGEEEKILLNSVRPIIKELDKVIPEYVKVRGELVNLLPGKSLIPHRDIYWFHKYSRRIHVPIYSNAYSANTFEGREYHLEVGNIYEINNRIIHSAYNNGTEPRIHLIIDFMPNEKFEEMKIDSTLATTIEDETNRSYY